MLSGAVRARVDGRSICAGCAGHGCCGVGLSDRFRRGPCHGHDPESGFHRGVQSLRERLRLLRERVPSGERRCRDGALHRARHRLRGTLPARRRIHGARQRGILVGVRALRRSLRRMCRRMRATRCRTLPTLCRSLQCLRGSVSHDGARCAVVGAGPTSIARVRLARIVDCARRPPALAIGERSMRSSPPREAVSHDTDGPAPRGALRNGGVSAVSADARRR
jgi:hypothetical protein